MTYNRLKLIKGGERMSNLEIKNETGIDWSGVSTHLPDGVVLENVVPDLETQWLEIGELDEMGSGRTVRNEEKKERG